MEKILKVLNDKGYENIQVNGNILTGFKDQRVMTGKIIDTEADLREDFDFFMIPYEKDFLFYSIQS